MNVQCPKRTVVRAQTDTLRDVAQRHGYLTDHAIAVALGLSPATLCRVLAGANASGTVIAAVWAGLANGDTETRIDDLFVVATPDERTVT